MVAAAGVPAAGDAGADSRGLVAVGLSAGHTSSSTGLGPLRA